MWTDDHQPPTPTSKWKAGETIEYKRTIFVPNYPYIGEAVRPPRDVRPGHQPRLVLNAPEASRREYVVAQFQILASSENIFLIYKDGLASGGSGRQEPAERVAVDEEDGDDVVPEPEEGRDALPASTTRARTCSTRRSRCVLKIGDQVVGQFTGRLQGAGAEDLSRDRRPARAGRHGGPRDRRGPHVQARRRRSAGTRHPGLPRLRRAQIGLQALGFAGV